MEWVFVHAKIKEGGLFPRKDCLNKGKQEHSFYFWLLSWRDLGCVLLQRCLARWGTGAGREFGARGNGWSGCRGPRAGGCAGSGASVTSPLRGQRVLAAAELLSSKLTACHPNQASRLKALAAPNSFGVSLPRGQVPEWVSLWAAPSIGFFSF